MARLSAVHAALGAAIAAGDATVQSVFLARAGAEALPIVLLSRALALPVLSLVYARIASDRSPRRVLAVLAALAAVAASGAWWLIQRGAAGAIAGYAAHEVLSGLLTVHWGVYLLASLRGEAALRGVGIVYAGARAGAAVAGGSIVAVSAVAGAPAGMFVVAGAFALVLVLVLALDRQATAPVARRASVPLRERLRVARSPLLVAIVASTVLMVGVRFLLRYQQQATLDAIAEDELAQLLGLYVVVANVAGALLSVVVMGRVLPALKLPGANLLYALLVLAAQLALLIVPGVPAALFARFADGELKHSLKTPVSSLFYEAFAEDARGPARALVIGLASPAAQAAGALLLAGVVAGASLLAASAVGLGFCACFALASVVQNRRWRDSVRPN